MNLRRILLAIRPSNFDIVGILILLNLWYTVTNISDWALLWASGFHNIPYSILWVWMNPWYWTQELYKFYVLGFQIVVTFIQFWLVKKGRMNVRVVQLFLLTTWMYRFFTVFQEVTPTTFLVFGNINPLFSLGFMLQKIPFWTFSLSDPHYQCAIGNCIFVTLGDSGGFQRALYPYTPDVVIHWTFVYWLVLPIYAWYKKRKNPVWNETRFWNWWSIPLVIMFILAVGILVTFGCCNGWHWLPGYGPGDKGFPF